MDSLDKALAALKEKGVTDIKIYATLKMERGLFYSIKRSATKKRRDELYEKVVELYPEIKEAVDTYTIDWKKQYDELMEKRVEELQAERDALKKEKEILQEEVKDLIDILKKK